MVGCSSTIVVVIGQCTRLFLPPTRRDNELRGAAFNIDDDALQGILHLYLARLALSPHFQYDAVAPKHNAASGKSMPKSTFIGRLSIRAVPRLELHSFNEDLLYKKHSHTNTL